MPETENIPETLNIPKICIAEPPPTFLSSEILSYSNISEKKLIKTVVLYVVLHDQLATVYKVYLFGKSRNDSIQYVLCMFVEIVIHQTD